MALFRTGSKGGVPTTLVAVLIGLLTLAVFFPAVHNGFVNWDDERNLVSNPNIRSFDGDHVEWMFTNQWMSRYIPLTWMSFGIDYAIWKESAFGYHLTNVLLHAANVAVFFLLAVAIFRRTLLQGASQREGWLLGGAAFAALFFGLHPLRVESVAWVTQRSDVLSGLFYILALLAYLHAFPEEPAQPPRRKYYLLCLALFVLAILSKEIAVTLPVILLLLDVYPLRRLGGTSGWWAGGEARMVWLEKTPFFVIAFADAALAIYMGIRDHLVIPLAVLGWMGRIAISVYGMAFYLLKTVFPIGLSPLYAFTFHKIDRPDFPFQVSAATVLLITLTCVALRQRFPCLLAAWIAFAITLFPVGGMIQNGLQIAADRYTYLACLGWALLAGAGVTLAGRALAQSHTGRALLASVALLVLGTLSLLTRAQIGVWHDSVALWTRAIAVEPSYAAYLNLANLLFNKGDALGAIDQYRRAIALRPDLAAGHEQMGRALLDLQRWSEAEQEFRIVEKLAPGVATYNSLGQALEMQGKLDEAIEAFQNALSLDLWNTDVRESLRRTLELKRSQQTTSSPPNPHDPH